MHFHCVGNKRFRALVHTFKKHYQKCSRCEKTALAEALVKQWREQTPPGRFLKQNKTSGLWNDVGQKARSKCSQLLREGKGEEEEEEEEEGEEDKDPMEEEAVPPPPPGFMDGNTRYSTPPQKKTPKEYQGSSPCSVMDVMDRKIYGVDNYDSDGEESLSESTFAGELEDLALPTMSRRGPVVRSYSNCSADPEPYPTDQTAERSPLGSFMRNMVREKEGMLGAVLHISIMPDNAATSPVGAKGNPVQKDGMKNVVACPFGAESRHSRSSTEMNEAITESEACRPRKISPSKRQR